MLATSCGYFPRASSCDSSLSDSMPPCYGHGCSGRRAAEYPDRPDRRHGVFRPGLLRRRDRDAEPRRAGRRGAAIHRFPQHGPLLADPGNADERHLQQRLERPAGDHPRGAWSRRLSDGHGRQVASGRKSEEERADPTRLRSLLRHHGRRRIVLDSTRSDARYRVRRARRRETTTTPTRSARRPPSRSRTFADDDEPFFQYVAFTAAHWPIHAPEETIQKYIERYQGGWEKLREDRYARMLEMGIIDRQRWPLPPMEPGVADWESVDHKAWRYPQHGGLRGHGRPHGSGRGTDRRCLEDEPANWTTH